MNLIKYDHNSDFIHKLRLESTFATYSLLSSQINTTNIPIHINDISNLNEEFEDLFEIERPVYFKEQVYSYGIVLFNKWCGFKNIKIDKFISSNEISEKIYNDSKNNREYQSRLCEISKKMFWYSSANYKSPLTLSLNEISSLNVSKHKELLIKLPENPYIGQHLYKGLIKRIYEDIPEDHFFSKLINAKIGKVNTQLSRLIGSIGYISDDMNIIDSKPITDSVLNGLSEDPFFRTAIGTRKGLVDKSRATPDSGYLERSLVVNLSPIELGDYDCNTNIGFIINIRNNKIGKSVIGRYYNDNGFWKLFKKTDINKYIGQELIFRSPITCQNSEFKVCRKCFGEYKLNTPYIGVLAGQYISERFCKRPFIW